MRNSRRASVAIAAVALGLALVGCGSDTATESSTSKETTSKATSKAEATKSAPETSPAPAEGANYTIVDYIKENQIVETPIHRGDPGSPTLDLPIPPGWEDAGANAPEWAWGAIVFSDPAAAADPPSVIALMSKLTGNVDPAKIIEFAPNELKNLDGWDGTDGQSSTMSGFDAWQLSGTYVKDGATRLIGQKTVVIPGQDGMYVLQLNADGPEGQEGPMMDAMNLIDEQTTITP
ncbi:LpqN/LpqT family lipoprotein [Mycobacterium sp. NPDC050551]|uniref:LpqN/LpqT family lipoprotein n=1 Tax=Mycobacterium sp. NPDC050551 TaxID=3155407 RepID=UPI00343B6576